MRIPPGGLALVVGIGLLLGACATGPGGTDERGGPPGRGRGPGMGLPPASRADAGWNRYDLNGDGKVTRAEFSAVRNECFLRADADGNGVVGRAEIQRLRQGGPAAPDGPAAPPPEGGGQGEVVREEYDRATESLWRTLDGNGDTVLAGMELEALAAAARRDLCPSAAPAPPPDGPRPGGPGRRR